MWWGRPWPRSAAAPRWTNTGKTPLSGISKAGKNKTKQRPPGFPDRSEEHTSELQSRFDLVCRLLLEKKNKHSGVELALSRLASLLPLWLPRPPPPTLLPYTTLFRSGHPPELRCGGAGRGRVPRQRPAGRTLERRH